ncbi:MAG TPA: hypothetical protein VMF66_13030 [Candidatus Acidoferrum sp.]|nr:hypothetical protein [Candidatus Acidoferrum sp.]
MQRPQQSGYALLLVLFMMTMMLVTSTAIFMNRRTEGMREREDQMIWRGNQFVRAIRVYYRKTGHYPQDIDALQKGVANLHFIRSEALKDPMNSDEDGKWRFIYTNPAGQIIGSVKYATMQQMAILDLYSTQVAALQKSGSDSDEDNSDQSGPGSTESCPPGTSNTQAPIAQSSTSTPGQVSPLAPSSGGLSSGFSLGGNSGTQGQNGCMAQFPGMPAIAPAALQAMVQMKPTGPVDSPVIGGFLVGVGSTVNRTSVKVYKGGKKYNQWEFIYNPIEEQALAIQQGLSQAGSAGGLLGSPAGSSQSPTSQPPQNQQ